MESASARAFSDGEGKAADTALAEARAVLGVVVGELMARARPLTMAAQDIGNETEAGNETELLGVRFCKKGGKWGKGGKKKREIKRNKSNTQYAICNMKSKLVRRRTVWFVDLNEKKE